MRDFAARFGLPDVADRPRAWFIARMNNVLLDSQAMAETRDGFTLDDHAYGLANHLGIRYDKGLVRVSQLTGHSAIERYLPADFAMFLAALEYLVEALPQKQSDSLDQLITAAISEAPGDLFVRWEDHRFYPSGAQLLDTELVTGPLLWLRQTIPAAAAPIERALDSLLAGQREPGRLRSVITDCYEALETAAKHVCGNTRDLSANREPLTRAARLNDVTAQVLRSYIPFGNRYRHGATDPVPDPTYADAEGFLYLTGLLLRAVSTQRPTPAAD